MSRAFILFAQSGVSAGICTAAAATAWQPRGDVATQTATVSIYLKYKL